MNDCEKKKSSVSILFSLRNQEQECISVLFYMLYRLLQNPLSFYTVNDFHLQPKGRHHAKEAIFFEMSDQEFLYWDVPCTFSIELTKERDIKTQWWHRSTCRQLRLHHVYTFFEELGHFCQDYYPILSRLFTILQKEMNCDPKECSFCTSRSHYVNKAYHHYHGQYESLVWDSIDMYFPFPLTNRESHILSSFETHLFSMDQLFRQCPQKHVQIAFLTNILQDRVDTLSNHLQPLIQNEDTRTIQESIVQFKRQILHFFDEQQTKFVKTKHIAFDSWFMALYDLSLLFSEEKLDNTDTAAHFIKKAIALLHIYFLKPPPLSHDTIFYLSDASDECIPIQNADWKSLDKIHPMLRGEYFSKA